MDYNAIIRVLDVTDDSGSVAEPISIQEAKDYMRLEGFVDDDASTTEALSDFDFDDNLIANLIHMARQIHEHNTHDHLRVKTLQVIATNLSGMIKLPGPVNSLPVVVDENGTTVDSANVKMVGDYLKSPCYKNMTLTYSAGHQYIPPNSRIELLRIVDYFYKNRGDEERAVFVSRLPAKILA